MRTWHRGAHVMWATCLHADASKPEDVKAIDFGAVLTILDGGTTYTVNTTIHHLIALRDRLNEAVALATTPPDIDPAAEAAEAELLAESKEQS